MKPTILICILVEYYFIKGDSLILRGFTIQHPTQTTQVDDTRLENIANARVTHLYESIIGNKNSVNFNIIKRNVHNCLQKGTTKDSNVTRMNKQKTVGNEKAFELFDPEWGTKPKSNNFTTPNIVMSLYESMENNSSVDVIRCLHSTQYSITNENVFIKFKYNRPKKQEMIIKSDLYIHRLNLQFKKQLTLFSIIRLYQIISNENYTSNADINKLLSVVYISSHSMGWQIFNVERTLENIETNEIELEFLLTINDSSDNTINPRYFGFDELQRANSPLLVLHFQQQTTSNDKNKTPHRTVDYTENITIFSNFSNADYKETHCKRQLYHVNLRRNGFENFIIYPNEIMLYRCSGLCDSILRNDFKNHARFLKLFQKENFQAFCIPESYSYTILVFYDNISNIIIKKYYEMIVNNCNCK